MNEKEKDGLLAFVRAMEAPTKELVNSFERVLNEQIALYGDVAHQSGGIVMSVFFRSFLETFLSEHDRIIFLEALLDELKK